MNRPSLHRFQHTTDVIPCDGTGHIIESIYLLRSHSSAEVASRDPLAVTESQQNSQMTAETEACAGSDLRPVLHNEGRKNCRRQLAERSDASSAERGESSGAIPAIPDSSLFAAPASWHEPCQRLQA